MIKKIVICIYFLFVLVFATASSFATWASDPTMILLLEVVVDVFFLFGIILFLNNKFTKWWLVPFISSVLGEVYLLIIDNRVGIKETIQWTLILLPAICLNLKVVGFMDTRKMKSGSV